MPSRVSAVHPADITETTNPAPRGSSGRQLYASAKTNSPVDSNVQSASRSISTIASPVQATQLYNSSLVPQNTQPRAPSYTQPPQARSPMVSNVPATMPQNQPWYGPQPSFSTPNPQPTAYNPGSAPYPYPYPPPPQFSPAQVPYSNIPQPPSNYAVPGNYAPAPPPNYGPPQPTGYPQQMSYPAPPVSYPTPPVSYPASQPRGYNPPEESSHHKGLGTNVMLGVAEFLGGVVLDEILHEGHHGGGGGHHPNQQGHGNHPQAQHHQQPHHRFRNSFFNHLDLSIITIVLFRQPILSGASSAGQR
jgi:hypothetical protein